MNTLAHVLFNYLVLINYFQSEKFWIIFFSVLPDIDHIPGLLKKGYNVDRFRTVFQEPLGLFLLIAFIWVFEFMTGWKIAWIATSALVLHWLIDFLTVDTRPLDPFNKKVINFFFHTKNQRIFREIAFTAILFLVLCLT